MDTRTAVWVSTAEKFSKIVLGETRNFSRKFRGVSAPALYKNPAVNSNRAPPPRDPPVLKILQSEFGRRLKKLPVPVLKGKT